jgi:hypothetical protein
MELNKHKWTKIRIDILIYTWTSDELQIALKLTTK